MSNSAPKLPPEAFATGASVAVTDRQMQPGFLAHRHHSLSRDVRNQLGGKRQETYYVTACTAGAGVEGPDDADEAYLVSIHWAHHQGADACTKDACFPQAVAA